MGTRASTLIGVVLHAVAASVGDALSTVAMPEVMFIRHGRTEMNEHLSRPGNQWGAPNFLDPGLWDTTLTNVGEYQAKQLNEQLTVQLSGRRVDLLVSSPLRRALQTAEIAFAGIECTTYDVSPLAAERCFLSSDVGSHPDVLRRTFRPEWALGFDALSDEWWYRPVTPHDEWRPPGTYLNVGEPDDTFYRRMRDLLAYLRSKLSSNQRVALVAHWGTIYALTGLSLRNAECITLPASELTAEPFIIPDT